MDSSITNFYIKLHASGHVDESMSLSNTFLCDGKWHMISCWSHLVAYGSPSLRFCVILILAARRKGLTNVRCSDLILSCKQLEIFSIRTKCNFWLIFIQSSACCLFCLTWYYWQSLEPNKNLYLIFGKPMSSFDLSLVYQ